MSRHGETHVEVLGQHALGASSPVRRDTLFRVSSMSKPITAVLALILIEECKLRLDDPIDRWLPELSQRRVLRRIDSSLDDTVPAKRPISVRDLLTFRMGFGQMMARPDAYPILKAAHERQIGMGPPEPSVTPAPDEWLRRLGELPLMYQPGEQWMYHTSSDALGLLLARATGKPLPALFDERIFQPLGMKDTGFSVREDQRERFATGYWNNFQSGAFEVFDPAEGGQWNQPPAFHSGGGGLVSTADDYFAFASMLHDHGQHARGRLLSRPSVELMTSDQLSLSQKTATLMSGFFDNHGWGFGVAVVTRRGSIGQSVGKYGWDGGLGTTWANDPSEDLISILLTQRAWTSPTPPPVALDFATSVYQALGD
jgi:CubicO group peptidase (beta-lactamase class C family)